jgi:hypothetical protein
MSELRPGITAVIAAHPARLRNGFLVRALKSVCSQTLQPDAILVVNDVEKRGAGWARQTILNQVNTTRFAWLDSDDKWYPQHLEKLSRLMDETGAKYVFSWFDGQYDPLGHFGKQFNVCAPHHTTITALVDTALAQEVGYPESDHAGVYSGEDWVFISRMAEICCERGFSMVHLPEKTWWWEQGNQNSSGLPNKGDAAL